MTTRLGRPPLPTEDKKIPILVKFPPRLKERIDAALAGEDRVKWILDACAERLDRLPLK